MVTMKWTTDAQGKPVAAWQAEAPAETAETQSRVFVARYHKAVRLTITTRHPARRPLRTLALLAATVAGR